MSIIKKLAKLSGVAMLLSSGASAMSGSVPHVLLHCDVKQQAPLCAALAQALTAELPQHRLTVSADVGGGADLIVRYVEKHREADWQSGYLTWHSDDGRDGVGPVIEYSVMDRLLEPKDLVPFALQLVRSSELPL